MQIKLFLFFQITVITCSVFAADKLSLEFGTGLDGAMRWRGNGLLRVNDWSFGLSGQLNSSNNIKAMGGINSPFLALGHLSDSGLASEIRNPEFKALGRLKEKTFFRADLRSFSDSRYGVVLFTPNRKFGAGAEHRAYNDTGFFWLTPIHSDYYHLELLFTGIQKKAEKADTGWFPKEFEHPGGIITSAIVKNSFGPGPWTVGLSFIISGGESFRPGVLLAFAADLSGKTWKTRFRSTWASEYYRTGDGEIMDVPAGMAWDGRLTANSRLILGGGLELPLIRSRWNTNTDDETGKLEIGWIFKPEKLLIVLNWTGLTREPVLKNIGSEFNFSLGRINCDISGKWDFKSEFLLGFGLEANFNRLFILGTRVKLHGKAELLLNGGLYLKFRKKKTRLILRFNASDLPRDWIDGPTGAGDMDIELRWIQNF